MVYKTKGTCSSEIHVDLNGDTIEHVTFVGGCSGNTQGVAKLVEGMKAEDAIARLVASAAAFVRHPARISLQRL